MSISFGSIPGKTEQTFLVRVTSEFVEDKKEKRKMWKRFTATFTDKQPGAQTVLRFLYKTTQYPMILRHLKHFDLTICD